MNSFRTLGIYFFLIINLISTDSNFFLSANEIDDDERAHAFCLVGRSSRVRGEIFDKVLQSIVRVWRIECVPSDRVLDEPSQFDFLHTLSEKTKLIFWIDEDKNQELILRGFDAEVRLYWDIVRTKSCSGADEDCDQGFRRLHESLPLVGYISEGRLISWSDRDRSVIVAQRGKTERQKGWPLYLKKPAKKDAGMSFNLKVSEEGPRLVGSPDLQGRLEKQKDLWLWSVEAR